MSFFLLQTFCLIKDLNWGLQSWNHEIKYQENYKHLLIFPRKNEIQRVTYSLFIAFSKWAKVEGYSDLSVTYHSSLKIHLNHKLGSFRTEVLQDLQQYSNFLTANKFEGYSPFIELFWGLHTFWKSCARIEYQVSMKNKFKCKLQLPNFVKKWKKLLWSMYWGLYCYRMLSSKSKNYAVSLLCNITQRWQLISVSTIKYYSFSCNLN